MGDASKSPKGGAASKSPKAGDASKSPKGGPQHRLHAVAGVDTVVVGAGHSGLAMSRMLAARGVEHVVLERGEVANAWRTERWDSLRLLTPNWQSRLPGYRYSGPDPDGYMTSAEVGDFIAAYAQRSGAPVRTGTTVQSVRAAGDGYVVETDRATWRCRAVVLAHGAHGVPNVPELAARLPRSVRTLTANEYRSPAMLDFGRVLVVGGSATGLQLADEIRRSGRPVTLAVGEHIRMPRLYRGRDVQWWLDAAGVLDERHDEVDDLVRARRVPSPQLLGSPERRTLDLNALREQGVELVGRLAGTDGSRLLFSGSLTNECAMADLKLARLLERFDDWAAERRIGDAVGAPERFAPTRVATSPRGMLDLAKEPIATIIWATGFRPDYSWLHVPVLDARGRLRHEGGVVAAPGLYTLGLNFMRRRKSSYMHGAEADARDLSAHLLAHLRGAHPREQCVA
ncbi:MAG TPA: NAD(P)-binding domain-containing protein [Gammaproteobacteria bacterium]|nr:NAD(P)-binding domain-containing protein [Gammaproteobacteria bacterium]